MMGKICLDVVWREWMLSVTDGRSMSVPGQREVAEEQVVAPGEEQRKDRQRGIPKSAEDKRRTRIK